MNHTVSEQYLAQHPFIETVLVIIVTALVFVDGIKKVRRYWVDKKKAAQFHGQLVILIIQVSL